MKNKRSKMTFMEKKIDDVHVLVEMEEIAVLRMMEITPLIGKRAFVLYKGKQLRLERLKRGLRKFWCSIDDQFFMNLLMEK